MTVLVLIMAKKKTKIKKRSKLKITFIMNAPKGREFVLKDGTRLRSLKELAFALGDMADEVFWHHVNEAGNDFANWVDGVFKDKELSDTLRGVKDKVHAQLGVLKHIVKKIAK